MVQAGIDRIVHDDNRLLLGRNFGLVTNPTGVTRDLEPTWQALTRKNIGRLAALFGPEHGWSGNTQDELPVKSSVHPIVDVPVFSLYGDHRKPSPQTLDGLDALVFDIQDVGVRFYTYISTMYLCMKACAESGISFIVLDRPNPIAGRFVEGNVLDCEYHSFLGIGPLPIRHGMTVGELARLFNDSIHCSLEVVPMKGWSRDMFFDDTGLPWVMPSPNLPTLDTAVVYPGMCLIEGTNVSEGRGTTKPFEIIGAPWVDGYQLARQLNALAFPGAGFRACHFVPTYGKYLGQECQGIQVHVVDRDVLEPVALGLWVVNTLRTLHPERLQWRSDAGDGRENGTPMIDWLVGTDKLRLGAAPDEIIAEFRQQAAVFKEQRQQYLLYK